MGKNLKNLMQLDYSSKLLFCFLGLILVAGLPAIVFSENNFSQEQLDSGRYSMADPNGPGVGEGVSEDGTSKVSSQYLDYSGEELPDISSNEVEASVLNGCNCVIFRMDDLQDFFVNSVQEAMMEN